MTEADIYKKIRPWVLEQGGRILRIENAVSQGTVDSILFYRGRSLMLEFKVIKSRKIKIRPSQISTAADYTKTAIPNDQYNFVCAEDSGLGIELYTMNELRHAPYTTTTTEGLVFSLKNINPAYVWSSNLDFVLWLKQFN